MNVFAKQRTLDRVDLWWMCEPTARLPLTRGSGATMIGDSVTVTLISNEGSSCGPTQPADSSGRAINRPVRGIGWLAMQMTEKTPETKPYWHMV